MSDPIRELQQLSGIGAVTARRLVEAGISTFAAIVGAGEEGLRLVSGIKPHNIPEILAQAAVLAGPPEQPLPDAPQSAVDDDLKVMVADLRIAIQHIATAARDRFPVELADKFGRKLTRNMVAGLDALYAIEELLERRPKRCGKALAKAQKRLEGLADAEPEQIRKGLKQARKALERATV